MSSNLKLSVMAFVITLYLIPIHYFAAEGAWRDLETYILQANGVEPASYRAAKDMWDKTKPENKPLPEGK